MSYKAVIFDLVGTLVDERYGAYAAMLERVAGLLGVSIETFTRANAADARARNVGEYESVAHQFDAQCRELAISPSPERLAEAIGAYTDLQRTRLVPRDGVLETLDRLGRLGLKRGLISNCPQVFVDLWPETELSAHLDDAVLSAQVKLVKPDPAIYRLACQRLGVEPGECLYVGDGGADELTGAAAVGMHAVLIRVPYADETVLGTGRQEWNGAIVKSIPEVLGLV